jgi:Flp pilus assembly protein TadG
MNAQHRLRGASLPETSIVIVVVLALIFGIIDFGRAMYTYSYVAQVARQGARWAIVRGSKCNSAEISPCPARSGSADVGPYVQSLNEGAMNGTDLSASLSWPECPSGVTGNAPGCTAQVTVSYPFTFVAPFVSQLTIPMASTSRMVISQ